MGVGLIREQERREADAALNRGMTDLLRSAAGRSSTPTPSSSPLAQALSAFETAKASGDTVEIARADAAVETLLAEIRERHKTPAPDFGAGARRPAPHDGETFSDRLRRERGERF